MKQIKCLLRLCFLFLVFSTLHLNSIQAAAPLTPPIDTTETTVCANKLPYRHLGNTYTNEGSYYITMQSVGGRDSACVHLNLFLASSDTINLSGCASEFPLHYEQLSFLDSTVLTTSYSQDTNGCPITHTFNIVKYPVYNDTLNMSICSSELPYSIFDTLLAEAGTYEFHYTSVQGCDSSYVLNLAVNQAYTLTDTLVETVCSHDLPYHYGDSTFTQTGVYDFSIKTVSGCDSIGVHLDLTVIQTHYDTLTFDVCSNTFPFHLNAVRVYDAPGVYEYYQNDNNICHNVTVIVLNELPSYNDTLRANWCSAQGPYAFADTSFTESTTYTYASHTTLGCDSITTLVLTVNPSYNDTLVDTLTLCAYDLPYEIGDVTLLAAGDYEIDIPTAAGCDSLHLYLNLQVNDFPQDTVELTICENNFPFDYLGHQIDSAGVYSLHISDSLTIGCDTVRQLIVNSSLIYHDSVSVTLCANEPYVIGDTSLTEPGIYDILLQTQAGCDSLVTITLLHNPIYYGDTLPFTICENALPFEYADTSFTTAGVHHVQLYTAAGCDSIIPINLTILPIIYNADTLQHTICADQLPYTTIFGEVIEAAGLYTYTVNSVVTGCDSVFYFRLNVNPNPTPIITGPGHLCVGSTANLSASVGMEQYLWNTGNTSQMINIENAGTYRVTVTNAFGCTASVDHIVAEAQLPTFELTNTQTICQGDDVTLTITGADHYQWSTGQTSSSISVHPTATTTYQVSAYTSAPCMREGSVTVVVNELPTVAITGSDAFCQGSNIELTATGATSYHWSTNSVNDRITVFNAGTIYVTGTDAHGCSNTASKLVSVYPLPTVTINGRTPFCQGETTTLTASGAQSYIWDNGATTSTINTSYGGNYSVTGTDAHGCQSTANKQITIWQVSAQISGSRNFCQGQHTTLNVTGNESYTYRWNDGSTSSSLDVYTAGQYAVTVTNSLGCSNTISATVSEYALPTPTITGPATVCQGRNATLVAGGGTSYHWSDGTNNAYLSAMATGTYFVTVTNQNGCSATTSHTVIVNPAPAITLTAQNSICMGETVSIYANASNGVQYMWPLNGLSGQLITVSPTSTTSYIVNVTDDNGCTGTASTTITVNANPIPSINGTTEFCQGDSVALVATGGTSYYWSNGLSTNSITVTNSGMYTVTVSNAFDCTATASKNVTVSNLPTAHISGNFDICEGSSTELTVTASAGCTYLWSTRSTQNHITVNTPGTYKVTVSNALGCTTVDSVVVTTKPLPQLQFGANHTICSGQSYTYTLPVSSDITYRWSNNASGNSITVSTQGVYTVTATNQYGCSAVASDSLIVHPLPTPVISGSSTVCRGSSTILTANGGVSYLWSNGSTTRDIAVFPNTNTTYAVTVTDEYGCFASASKQLTVNTPPAISILGNRYICAGGATTITVNGGNSYSWSNGVTANSINVTIPGTYYVTTSNTLGCQRRDSVIIVSRPNPVAQILGDSQICENTAHLLTATGGHHYSWSTGENTSAITIQPLVSTTYTVTAYDSLNCSTTVSKVVNVEALPDVHISGLTTICMGETATFTASNGHTYLWSTGSTSPTINVSESGSYSVTASSVNGCTASESIQLVVNPVPQLSLTGSSTICENTTIPLVAHGGSSYVWSNGSTDSLINITTGGTYAVTASNVYGCSASTTHQVTQLQTPYLLLNTIGSLCQGGSTSIMAFGTASQYTWDDGSTGQSYTVSPTSNTMYHVTATNDNGCTTVDSTLITVNPVYHVEVNDAICQNRPYNQYGFSLPSQITAGTFDYQLNLQTVHGCDSIITLHLTVNPIPVVPATISGPSAVTTHGSQMYTVENAQYVNTYEWRCSNVNWGLSNTNMNSVFLNINQNGSGVLTAKAINECGAVETSINIYCNVGIEEYVNETNIQLYPVPAHQFVNVNLEQSISNVNKIQLIDNLGRVLQTVQVTESNFQIDLTPYATGTYFLRFYNENGKSIDTRKLIIR